MSALALLALLWAQPAPTPAPRATPQPARRAYTNDDLEGYGEERAQDAPSPVPTASPAESASGGAPSGEEGRSESASILAQVKQARESLAEAEQARDAAREIVSGLELRVNPMSTDFEGDPYLGFSLQDELRQAREALQEREVALAGAREELDLAETRARRAGVRLPPQPER